MRSSSARPRDQAAVGVCPSNPIKNFTWAGVTVVNPFSGSRHALLQAQLDEDAE